jgi:hypothetical protein
MFNGRRQPSCDGTSRMTRECQVRICERLGVKFPGPTRHPRRRRPKPHGRACPLRPESNHRQSKCDPSICAISDRTQRSKIRAYSITSSASSCNALGTSTPSNLAVCALMTNSNLVDCTTGKSAGFAPLRI